MNMRTFLLLLFILLICLFAAVNWGAFATPTPLSLLVTTIVAPLGLVMLGLSALLTLGFFLYGAWMQTEHLLEAKRQAREIDAQRKLADNAEASRLTELQSTLVNELLTLRQQAETRHSQLLERMERGEGELRAALEQNANSVAATLGELEDRLEKSGIAPSRFKQIGP